MNRFFILLFGWMFYTLPSTASTLDSVRISLLTCAPGTEIYALFGHSALRYEHPSLNQDWVFNYGMFSFRDPNFVMRFVKGETDYQLGVVPFSRFAVEYEERGSTVYQQVLNLSDEEKVRLIRLLEENYLPANRVYRYNYFYDNCTTRARDKVEESIDGTVVYPERLDALTFRDIIHIYTANSEWSELGIDLCLGVEADEQIDERKQMFAPFFMLEAARGAVIHRADTVVPLIKEEFLAVKAPPRADTASYPSPLFCVILLLILTFVMVGCGIRRGRMFWWWNLFLFGLQGLGGCIIAFLFFFSVHPTVGSNWLIILFNPLPLCYLPWMIYKGVKGEKDLYHWINAFCLTSFILLMPFLQQKFNVTVLPLALCFLFTSVGHLIIYYKKH